MGSHFQENNQKARNGFLYVEKLRPIFFLSPNKEFEPSSLCQTCFTPADSNAVHLESLGVRNLLALDYQLKGITKLSRALSQGFYSIQVHQGQIEHLIKQKSIKVFLANYQNPLDQQILSFALSTFQEYPQFIPKVSPANSYHSTNKEVENVSHVIFMNTKDADQHFDAIMCQLEPYSKSCQVKFIPTSISYESHSYLNSLKSNVRINFSHSYSFEDINQLQKAGENAMLIFKQHIRHDIWKNTAIMPLHVISVLTHYKSWQEAAPSEYIPIMKEFQNRYRSYYDLGYIGNIEDVINYCFRLLSANGLPSKSIAVDLMKYESMMMISLLVVANLYEKDIHLETIKIYESQLIEKFQKLARILSYEVADIYPPCTTSSVIEKEAVTSLLDYSIVSYQDDQECETHQISRKLAQHLELNFEEPDEDWAPTTRPEISVYVNVENLLARKWVSKIASSLLEIYNVTARTLLELQKVEVMEYSVFVRKVTEDFNETFKLQSVSHFESTVRNAIDLFEKEGFIVIQNLNNVRIIFLNNPLDNQNILQVINDIGEFLTD